MKKNNSVEILSWQETEEIIEKVNPQLAVHCKKLDRVNTFKTIKVKYPFGEDIIYKGKFKININGKNTWFDDNAVPKTIKSLLNYYWRTIPFGVVVQNTAESHISHSTHIVPFRLQYPGQTFAVRSIIDKSKYSGIIPGSFSTKAGCRSLIFLPKLTHNESNLRISRQYNIKKYLYPKTLSDQWYFFKELFDSANFKTTWNAELILFSKQFIAAIHKNTAIKLDLLYNHSKGIDIQSNEYVYNFIFSTLLKKIPLSLKHDQHVLYNLKQIIQIALGQMPGFIPSDNDLPGPISSFTEILLHCYKIRFNLPIFMHLNLYDNTNPIYYSLQKPTYFYEIPDQHKPIYTINLLTNIKKILILITDYILNEKGEHSLKNTILYKMLAETDFDFFHPKGNNIIDSNINRIAQEDLRFLTPPFDNPKLDMLSFPNHSPFFHGCIRIKPKK